MRVKGVLVVEDCLPDSAGRTRNFPPALECVANQPIAYHALDHLESAGVEEIIVVSSAEVAGDVRSCLAARSETARLAYVSTQGPVDLGVGVALAARLVGHTPCIVHLASGLLGEPLANLVGSLHDGPPDAMLILHRTETSEEHLDAETLKLLNIVEFDRDRAGLAMSGVWLFGAGTLSHLGGVPAQSEGKLDLTSLAERLGVAGGGFQVRVAESWRRYGGDNKDLLELNRIALDRLQAEVRRPDNHGNSVEGRVWIHESADVAGSVIVGPATVGPRAFIRDAYIGPYTAVGARARVEGAEIERSIISPGASIMHVSGRLVASVVGRDAKIFRDFSLPRAMRLQVGDGTEVALC